MVYKLLISSENDTLRKLFRLVKCRCSETPIPSKVFGSCSCPLTTPLTAPVPASTTLAATTMVNATPVSVPLVSAQQNFVGGRARNGNDYTSIMSNGRLMMNQSVPSTPY